MQLKKDIVIRNLKKQIIIKFKHFTITNRNKLIIVINKNSKHSTINTIIVNKDNIILKFNSFFIL